MYKDKRALVVHLRSYKKHILGPLFFEAADAIDELLAEKEEREKPAYWIKRTVNNDPLDPAGLFRNRFECSACGEWQSYGETKYCPNCGKPMQEPPEAHDCHNCKHRTRDMGRECRSCLDAGNFPLWERE